MLVAASILLLARGDWFGLLQMAVFLVASVIFVELEFGLPHFFDLLFVAAALLNAAGWVWSFYTAVPGYDEVAHFFTSFAFTLSFGYLSYGVVRHHFRQHLWHFIIVIASFGISLGALWEVAEWVFAKSLADPVSDIIMDAAGAILAGAIAAWVLGRPANEGKPS
jgi:VanZ family protein